MIKNTVTKTTPFEMLFKDIPIYFGLGLFVEFWCVCVLFVA